MTDKTSAATPREPIVVGNPYVNTWRYKLLMLPRPIIDVSGGGPSKAPRLDGAGGRTYKGTVAEKREAMGIDWMTGSEIVEAIPPLYTRLIGEQVLEHLRTKVAA